MKKLLLFSAIFLVGQGVAFSQSNVETPAIFMATDSSVGKAPTYAMVLPADLVAMNSNLGKSTSILFHEGPPPHKAGPGLRFNTKELFYVYTDHAASPNHFAPSGWMGDYENLRLNMQSTENPADGKTCIKITYRPENHQGAGWAGMYWQDPVNNWGNKVGGYNLKGMKRLTFWARGEEGGELINEFKVGGIQGDRPDSDAIRMGPVILTQDWKQYVIELTDAQLSHISGGFAWAASEDDNPNGFTFYLDEIRFER